jgi:hypothetical protein
VQSLSISDPDEEAYDIERLIGDLHSKAVGNFTSNTVVVPVLQTLGVLLEGDALEKLQDSKEGKARYLHDLRT